MDRSLRLEIAGTSNVRDLGGTCIGGGLAIVPGRLYRGEALVLPDATGTKAAVWSDAQIDVYRALGLATVIDLRAATEVAMAPSAWARASNAALRLLPVNEGGEGDATDFVRRLRAGTLRQFSADDLADYYATTLRRRATVFGAAITALAAPGALPALVHCTAGKDRTGILIALVLEVLGTPRERVVADYALTGILRPNRVAAYADVLSAQGIEPAEVSALFDAPPRAMSALLDGVDAEFGSVRQFLIDVAGVDPDALTALAEGLSTPSS